MNPDDIIARQVEQLDKEKREQQIRLKTQEKKVFGFVLQCISETEQRFVSFTHPSIPFIHSIHSFINAFNFSIFA